MYAPPIYIVLFICIAICPGLVYNRAVTERETLYREKAEASLAGAVSEYANGRYNNCANRCYYGCFQAAIYALQEAGITPTGPHAACLCQPHLSTHRPMREKQRCPRLISSAWAHAWQAS